MSHWFVVQNVPHPPYTDLQCNNYWLQYNHFSYFKTWADVLILEVSLLECFF